MTEAANRTLKRRRAVSQKPGPASAVSVENKPATAPHFSRRDSKISKVLALLQRGEGATLEEMVAATGCLPHTTRAALTRPKKTGHTIDRRKRGGTSCYRAKADA